NKTPIRKPEPTRDGGIAMAKIEKSIDVNVPVRTAYNQWTQFEEFPRFMEGVKAVQQVDDRRLRWQAEIGGKDETWNAVITEQTSDQRVAWTSTTGAKNAGVVTFHRLANDKTRVMLQLDYEPEGVVENVGSMLGIVKGRVEGDLKRFKEFIEQRGRETGAWRGEIEQKDVR
ncbi:MAG: SRPBCC family protein, partial [Anaerolineales bacterium]